MGICGARGRMGLGTRARNRVRSSGVRRLRRTWMTSLWTYCGNLWHILQIEAQPTACYPSNLPTPRFLGMTFWESWGFLAWMDYIFDCCPTICQDSSKAETKQEICYDLLSFPKEHLARHTHSVCICMRPNTRVLSTNSVAWHFGELEAKESLSWWDGLWKLGSCATGGTKFWNQRLATCDIQRNDRAHVPFFSA